MPSFTDLAPVIVVLIVAGFVLLLTWHAWHQAHKGDGGKRSHRHQAGE